MPASADGMTADGGGVGGGEWSRPHSTEVGLRTEGTSMAGLRVKKSAGFRCTWWISTGLFVLCQTVFQLCHRVWCQTYITGQSVTLVNALH